MKVITLFNEKGGVGKTTCATTIASGMAIEGAKVLLIDADPQQGSSTSELRHSTKRSGLFHVTIEEAEWNKMLVQVAPEIWAGSYKHEGMLALLPGGTATMAIPSVTNNMMILMNRLADIEQYFDAVVIDTSPMPSQLHTMMYVASDYVIFPTSPESLSIEGVASTHNRLLDLNSLREGKGLNAVQLLGIQPMMTQPNTNAHSFGLGAIVAQFKNKVWASIPQRTVWRERSFAKKTIFAYKDEINQHDASGQAAVIESWALVNRVMKGVFGNV